MRPSRYHLADAHAPRSLFTAEERAGVRAFFGGERDTPPTPPTPLRDLVSLAHETGIGTLWVKDETQRLGLPAFKALGASYALAAMSALGALRAGATVVCASEGNHGRAVARAARANGLRAKVYVGMGVAAARAAAIAAEGAEVLRVDGAYDDAVRRAADDAAREGWTVISDTGWAGNDEIPLRIMLGYTHLMDECVRQWGRRAPDVVLVQAGVGGLAAAIASWWAERAGSRPKLVCVEPLDAACLLESARVGAESTTARLGDTILGPLRCGTPSSTAWPAIHAGFRAYLAIDDGWVVEALRRLSSAAGGDGAWAVGPAGVAGIGALLALRGDPALHPVADDLRLGRDTVALCIATEGATDPALVASVLAT